MKLETKIFMFAVILGFLFFPSYEFMQDGQGNVIARCHKVWGTVERKTSLHHGYFESTVWERVR